VPDADPHPPVIRTEASIDRAQPVVSGIAAAALHAQLTRAQIDLVMDDDDVGRRDLEKPRGSDPPFAVPIQSARISRAPLRVCDPGAAL